MAVQWPGLAVSHDEQDLLNPVAALLKGLAVLDEKPNETDATSTKAFEPTPYSMQVISAGALALSSTFSRFVAWLGGLGGIAAGAAGFFADLDAAPQAAALAGAAVLLSAAFISIALIVRADVTARSVAQAAEYAARGTIAAEFLTTTAKPAPVIAPDRARTWIKRKNTDKWCEVLRWDSDGDKSVVAVLKDEPDARVPLSDIRDARVL